MNASTDSSAGVPEPERIQGWRCIGCGKIDAPQPCIGVCQDRRFELVAATDYDALRMRVQALEGALALIARTPPRADKLADSWAALQGMARRLLG